MGKMKNWLMDMETDAVELSAFEFAIKHGKTNLKVYDRVQKRLDRCVNSHAHMKFLLQQSHKYITDSTSLDFTDRDVLIWREIFLTELNRVLNMPTEQLEKELNDDFDEDEEEDIEYVDDTEEK